MAVSRFNLKFSPLPTAGSSHDEPARPCTTCYGSGVDVDFGTACAKGCAAPAAEPSPAPALAVKPAKRTAERVAFDKALAAEIDRVITQDVPEVVRPCSVASGVTLKRRGRLITVEWFAGRALKSAEFFIYQGQAVIVSAPPVGWLPSRAAAHIERTLAAYAAKVEGRAA